MKVYNLKGGRFIEIEEHQVICDKCHGLGIKEIPSSTFTSPITGIICSKCKGDGYLDWIENIIGKNKKKE